MVKPRIIVTRKWPLEVEKILHAHYDAVFNESDQPMTCKALAAAMKDCDALCPTVSDRIDASVIGTSSRAKILANFGVGFNHIDLEAASVAGIKVSNTPHVLTDCTADLAMTLMLMVARRAGEGERHVRNGQWTGWRPTHMMGAKITGKKLGLIGFGRIAQAMARKAHFGFGMQIIFYNPSQPSDDIIEHLSAIRCDSPEAVMAEADFVSLHCPGGAATHHLINEARLNLMQEHAFLINSARGDVVDQHALLKALKNGKIAGAALDVYEGEPKIPQQLVQMENVVLLPHLGSATRETRIAMGMRVVENLAAFFAGKPLPDEVL